ncbi:MAG: helix-turn-helix transcriptional regulator [Lachnospiraceae bacterium]|nr:helix-turn-helix transcriptional regulator [Lachnospiraceae bacterium]
MNLREYLRKQNTSVYHLSKESGVPYTTLNSICNGTADIKECRVSTLLKICNALGVGLTDLIDDALPEVHAHNFIDDSIILNTVDLPRLVRFTIKELEEYDEKHDPMFFECADMLYMMADRFLKDGAIDTVTHDKLILKYPIA